MLSGVRQCPTLSSLSQQSGLHGVLSGLLSVGSRVCPGRCPQLVQEGLDAAEWQETLERLRDQTRRYSENPPPRDDESDDD